MTTSWTIAVMAAATMNFSTPSRAADYDPGSSYHHRAYHRVHVVRRRPRIIVIRPGFPQPEPFGWFNCCT